MLSADSHLHVCPKHITLKMSSRRDAACINWHFIRHRAAPAYCYAATAHLMEVPNKEEIQNTHIFSSHFPGKMYASTAATMAETGTQRKDGSHMPNDLRLSHKIEKQTKPIISATADVATGSSDFLLLAFICPHNA